MFLCSLLDILLLFIDCKGKTHTENLNSTEILLHFFTNSLKIAHTHTHTQKNIYGMTWSISTSFNSIQTWNVQFLHSFFFFQDTSEDSHLHVCMKSDSRFLIYFPYQTKEYQFYCTKYHEQIALFLMHISWT